ncbi:hypothetical protein tb265_29070 [Gemmatimonadetes bacterium T265]|nr:hypothetical protein tb265_29070 [Gemmatimonadetes bacterium T265]
MTAPAQPTSTVDAATMAEWNDLLQLDHDAVGSYTLAVEQLKAHAYRDTIRRYRGDHERHIAELTPAIRRHGGQPIDFPHPSSVDKLAVQGFASTGGGDTHVLISFRANERQARDKYARAVERAAAWPSDVQAIVRDAASDERRHYDWVDMTVQSLGVVSRGVEVFHARTHDAAEAVETQGMRGFEAARRAVAGSGLARRAAERPLAAALTVLGIGLLLGSVRRSR